MGEAGRDKARPARAVGVVFPEEEGAYETWLFLCMTDISPLDGDMRKDPLGVGDRRLFASMEDWETIGAEAGAGAGTDACASEMAVWALSCAMG